MITASPQNLTQAEETDLRTWLGKSGAHIMRKVIEAKLHGAQLKHLEEAMQTDQFPLKVQSATSSIEAAIRYQQFLEIWQELTDQPEDKPFETLKLIS